MVQGGQAIATVNLRKTKTRKEREIKRERERTQKEDREGEGGRGEREVNEKFRGRRSWGGTRGCLPFITAGYPLMESSCPHLSTVLPQHHAVPW